MSTYPAGYPVPTTTVDEFSRTPDYASPQQQGFSLVKEMEKKLGGKRPGR